MIAAFLASKTGIRIAAIGAAIIGALIVVLKIFNAGKESARVEQMEESIKSVKKKNQVHQRIDQEAIDEAITDPSRTPADVKRSRLFDEWSRD